MGNPNSVRWGLLSTARINRKVIPAIRASQRGELAAVASRKQETANAYAEKWEIPHAFGSYEAMLESDVVDAVYISLPNHLHAEWSLRAMQAGKHVLCEKPLAISVDEVDRMAAASRETGCVLAEAFMYRHHPQMKTAGEWVRSGRLGEVIQVRGVFNFKIQARSDVRLVPEYGGGSLWDVGVYPISFSQFILGGAPRQVSGFQQLSDTGVDEVFAGVLSYPGGQLAQVASSFRSPLYTRAEVIGTEGRLVMDRPFVWSDEKPQLMFYPSEGEAFEIELPEQMLYLGEVEDMHAAILDGARSYVSLAESRDHVRTAVALYEAARTGKVVLLE